MTTGKIKLLFIAMKVFSTQRITDINSFAVTVDETILNGTATVTDITGRKMTSVQLATENFANGVYFISLENEKGRMPKKLVIQK